MWTMFTFTISWLCWKISIMLVWKA
jgi:hypothetical protein